MDSNRKFQFVGTGITAGFIPLTDTCIYWFFTCALPSKDAHTNKLSQLDVAGKNLKYIQSRKFSRYTKDFLWLGLPWSCREKRKHYPSFQHNDIKISSLKQRESCSVFLKRGNKKVLKVA